MQRRVCEVLDAAEGNKLPLRELRRRLGEPDRSNLRRAIRGLLEREIVEEFRYGGKRHVGLTFWGYMYLSPPLARRRRPVSFDTKLAEARQVVGEVGFERRFVRNRLAGPRRSAFCTCCGGTPIPWRKVCR